MHELSFIKNVAKKEIIDLVILSFVHFTFNPHLFFL